MSNETLKTISDRRSNRSYKPEQITKDELDALLKAAVEAPSARNAQPWFFSVVQDVALLDEINEDIAVNTQKEKRDVFYGAPTVIFISGDDTNRWAALDSGIAVENIALAATSLGLGSVILGYPDHSLLGPKKDYFAKKLKFPEGTSFTIAIAVGYAKDTKAAHEVKGEKIAYVK